MAAVISEAASKKPKRGRPPVHTAERLAITASYFPPFRSRRGLIERDLALRALNLLLKAGDCEWLVSTEKAIDAGTGKLRFEILSALGRLNEDAEVLRVARQVCQLKPKSKEAVAMIRRYRTGKEPDADALDLANVIIDTVNRWLRARPSADWETVQSALGTAWVKVSEAREKHP